MVPPPSASPRAILKLGRMKHKLVMTTVMPGELSLTYASRSGQRRVRIELHGNGRTARLLIEDADLTEIEVNATVTLESNRLICEGEIHPKRSNGADRALIEVESFVDRPGGAISTGLEASVHDALTRFVNGVAGLLSDFSDTGGDQAQ